MQVVQFKFPVDVQQDATWNFGQRWVITKHRFHVTFFEIKIKSDLVDAVIKWVSSEISSLAALLASIDFSQWHVFPKEKQHFAVLVPADRQQWADIDSEARSNAIVKARQQFLLRMFSHFGCTAELALLEDDGTRWLYRDASGDALFECSYYNRPDVWFPHVTIALKFTHLSEPPTLNWPSSS